MGDLVGDGVLHPFMDNLIQPRISSVISRCLQLRDEGAPPGIMAVFVYPMNALAEDQPRQESPTPAENAIDVLCISGVKSYPHEHKTSKHYDPF